MPILALIGIFLLFSHEPVPAIDIPEQYELTDDSVPFNMIIKIATEKAYRVWGDVTPGPVIPMVDEDKCLMAYYVVFTRCETAFPGYSEVLREIQEGRKSRNSAASDLSDKGRRQTWGIDDYCTVLITARYSLKPIPEYFEGLPRFYTMGDLIEDVAAGEIGQDPELEYIYFFGRLDQVYEFRNGGKICFVDPFPVYNIPAANFQRRIESARNPDCEIEEEILGSRREEWDKLYNNPPSISNIVLVENYDRVPIYLWTAGCAPTAAAMVAGYYDNKYGVLDYTLGYGRLIDYYQAEYKFPCNDSGPVRESIPNILDEFRDAMNTNCAGGTQLDSVTPGIEYTFNTVNQYLFDIIETRDCDIPGDDCYDWCWGEITEQIDDNYPFLWVITCHDCPPGTIRGHALIALGYNDVDQTIAVYNTWDQQMHWWCHDHYGNNCDWYASQTRVHAVRPGGNDYPNDIRLLSPAGGDSIHVCREDTIKWYQWGDDIENVTIRYSIESGESWPLEGLIVSDFPSSGQGWHEYIWVPGIDIAGESLRIMITGLNQYGRLIASEGNFTDFTILNDYCAGDVNGSGNYDGLDITYGVNFFKGGPAPIYECRCTPESIWYVTGDVNGSCSYNGLDITYGVAYFKGGDDPIPCGDCPPN